MEERPGRILIDLLEEAILHCAYMCHSFPHNVTLIYKKYPTLSKVTISPKCLDIVVPVKVPTGKEKQIMTSEEDMLKGIFETLPIVGLYFLINALCGASFWYMVS